MTLGYEAGPATGMVEHAEQGVAILTLLGEHDVATGDGVRQRLSDLLARRSPIVIDLQPARFVDSSIIGSLVLAVREAQAAGVPLAVALSAARNQTVHGTLRVAGLLDALPIHPTRAEAVAAVAPRV